MQHLTSLLSGRRNIKLLNEFSSWKKNFNGIDQDPLQALKYRSVTDIVRPIHEIVRRREEATGHYVRDK